MLAKIKMFIWKIYSISCVIFTFKAERDNILTDKETVEYLIVNKKSLIRLGDGEFRLMLKNKGIPYQEYSNELKDEMLMIMEEYSKQEESEYLLSIPQEFMTCSGRWLFQQPITYLEHWAWIRKYYRFKMNRDKTYGDAFLFSKNNEEIYDELFSNLERVIFVHREIKYANQFSMKYHVKTEYIKVPASNSYTFIDEIENEIKKLTLDKSIPILISAGPAAKILTFRLSKQGYLVYDTGHCWDDPLYMPK